MKIHHIGYLVKNIENALTTFENLGYEVSQETMYDNIRDVNICFMEKDGYRIELVSPCSEGSIVAGLMRKYKNSPYHICYETTDYDKDYENLINSGYMAIDKLTPAPAIAGHEVVFLMNPVIGMIELIK